jgi:hypothetical protein
MFGSFRAAWRLIREEGYITHERVVGSNWYIFWLYLEDRWEYLPFETIKVKGNRYHWEPLVRDIELVATAIGNSKKLWLVVERTEEERGDRAWWWMIYWRFSRKNYLLATHRTDGPFIMVV